MLDSGVLDKGDGVGQCDGQRHEVAVLDKWEGFELGMLNKWKGFEQVGRFWTGC